MNCTVARDAILAQTHPAQLRGESGAHVRQCAACQRWHQEYLRIESLILQLPVPVSSHGKARTLEQLETLTVTAVSAATPATPAKPATPRRRSLIQEWWPTGVAAAVLLTGTVIYFSSGRPTGGDLAAKPKDPLLEKVVLAKVSVDTAKDTPERIKALADLSDLLCEQARSLNKISTANDMEAVAEMYAHVINEALLVQVRNLNDADRRTLLGDYAERLARAEQDTTQLLNEAPAGSVAPLQEMARIARQGRETIAEIRRKAS